MSRVVRSPQAREDLVEIGRRIAERDPRAADRLLDRVAAAAERLASNPFLGAARPDLAPDARHAVVRPCLMLHRAIQDGIEIIRVVHGARELAGLFEAGEEAG